MSDDRIDQPPTGQPLGFPDVVLAGAARSGTSFLAARLSQHPAIDGGAIKEPQFFSRNAERGAEWYDGLFEPRRPGLLRLDASVSYTFPQHPEALPLLAAAAPGAKVVYVVRDPLERAISHYRLLSKYFSREEQVDFGGAARTNPVYLGASDYEHWLGRLTESWGRDHLLVVPFEVTTKGDEATDRVFEFLGLDPVDLGASSGKEHRNEVVEFRREWLRVLRRKVRHSRAYPWLRRTLGPSTMRRLRSAVTRTPEELTDKAALASCTPAQRAEIDALVARSRAAVVAVLEEQDRRLGLDWASVWRGADADASPVD